MSRLKNMTAQISSVLPAGTPVELVSLDVLAIGELRPDLLSPMAVFDHGEQHFEVVCPDPALTRPQRNVTDRVEVTCDIDELAALVRRCWIETHGDHHVS